MHTAVVILCTGEYWKGAKVMFHTLEKYGNLPDTVDRITLGMNECDFAEPVPITEDYSWVQVSQKFFPKVADKFQALTLSYDRVILMDADMLCVGDCSLLWSESIGCLPFYAVRDVASPVYYKKKIRKLGLNPNLLFNAGTMVFQMDELGPRFLTDLMECISEGSVKSYDGGDQGYLNSYFQDREIEVGYLPLEYNACTDMHWPRLDMDLCKVVHFTGANINPWLDAIDIPDDDYRWPALRKWEREWEDCNGRGG